MIQRMIGVLRQATAPHVDSSRRTFVLVVVTGLSFAAMVASHLDGVNGPSYWKWAWRTKAFYDCACIFAAAVPAVMAIPLLTRADAAERRAGDAFERRWLTRRAVAGCALLVTSTFLMQMASLSSPRDRSGVARMVAIVQDYNSNGHYSDAAVLSRSGYDAGDVLAAYPAIVPSLSRHGAHRPPGPLLLTMAARKAGGPIGAGLAAVALASLIGPAIYMLILSQGGTRTAAGFAGAAFSVMASSVVFTPLFDPVYAVVTCVILTAWPIALRSSMSEGAPVRLRAAAGPLGFGVLFAGALFVNFSFLVLVPYFAADAILHRRTAGGRWGPALAAVGLLGTYAVGYGITGYNPLESLWAVLAHESGSKASLNYPFPRSVGFAYLDFMLGTGWALGVLALVTQFQPDIWTSRRTYMLSIAGHGIVIFLFATMLIPSESSRLGLTVYPLLATAVGVGAENWTTRQRCGAVALVALVTTVLAANMIFVEVT